jgi:hypothetical protein
MPLKNETSMYNTKAYNDSPTACNILFKRCLWVLSTALVKLNDNSSYIRLQTIWIYVIVTIWHNNRLELIHSFWQCWGVEICKSGILLRTDWLTTQLKGWFRTRLVSKQFEKWTQMQQEYWYHTRIRYTLRVQSLTMNASGGDENCPEGPSIRGRDWVLCGCRNKKP